MRYVKVLLLVLIFFLCMVFFFQNQTVLSTEMVLHLNLFFIDPMASISLPFYFLVLAAFLIGAICSVLFLIWDKMHISARLMKTTWRVRALEKEVAELKAAQAPKEEKSGGLFSRKPKEDKSLTAAPVASIEEKPKAEVEDISAPDPDKNN